MASGESVVEAPLVAEPVYEVEALTATPLVPNWGTYRGSALTYAEVLSV